LQISRIHVIPSYSLQTFSRNINTRLSRLDMFKEYALHADEGPLNLDRYNGVKKLSNNMLEVCHENSEWITSTVLQWKSFEESLSKLLSWMNNLKQTSLSPLREQPEGSIDTVVLKAMKLRELDKKLNDRQSTRDAIVYEGEQVITATGWF